MPYRDPEQRKAYERERSRIRRARRVNTDRENAVENATDPRDRPATDPAEMSEFQPKFDRDGRLATDPDGKAVSGAVPGTVEAETDRPSRDLPARPTARPTRDLPETDPPPFSAWELQERAWSAHHGIAPPTPESQRGGAPPIVPHCHTCGRLVVACRCDPPDDLERYRVHKANEDARAARALEHYKPRTGHPSGQDGDR